MNNFFSLRIWKVAWPVCLGYIPLGMACGMFAQKAGLEFWQAVGMCMIVYAGSGQFIGIAMMMQSASIVSIALTIFIVNLRHFLFSSTLIKYLKGKSPFFLSAYAHQITDESFAVNLAAFHNVKDWSPNDAIKVNIVCHIVWISSNALGFISGQLIQVDIQLVGYALTAMFIGLWSGYLQKKSMFLAGILAGILAIVLAMFVGYKMYIVLAAVIVSTAFCFYELSQRKEE